ncbi:sel1 repeat family protein [Undibacterium jejuense]|uniref:Sel1 repeat family protein n=1 Tax=Undibacterium jejuense TaxID=1344949 RepID=A0A923KKC9_9BURK|nr:tetratricopeptide repeat protein [Undibacterium jejuense]MBC3861750.1 sel1 repeat family protein [Undibacterium jejuense]
MQTILHLIALILIPLTISACNPPVKQNPTNAEIESMGILALQSQQQDAIRTLTSWAMQGNAIAQRELAITLAANKDKQKEAADWFKKAAEGGDAGAQFFYAEANYKSKLGLKQNYTEAWKWYAGASRQNNDKASFMLSRMCKYGEGVPLNLEQSIHWLQVASEQGNAQAMFLLSNAYTRGEGITKDPALAHHWLELSAKGDFPPAIQALAMELTDKANATEAEKDHARHLLKEANDERKMHWNQYQ